MGKIGSQQLHDPYEMSNASTCTFGLTERLWRGPLLRLLLEQFEVDVVGCVRASVSCVRFTRIAHQSWQTQTHLRLCECGFAGKTRCIVFHPNPSNPLSYVWSFSSRSMFVYSCLHTYPSIFRPFREQSEEFARSTNYMPQTLLNNNNDHNGKRRQTIAKHAHVYNLDTNTD